MKGKSYNKENKLMKGFYTDKIAKLVADESICDQYSIDYENQIKVNCFCEKITLLGTSSILSCPPYDNNELCHKIVPGNLGLDYELDIDYHYQAESILLKRKKLTYTVNKELDETCSQNKLDKTDSMNKQEFDCAQNSQNQVFQLQVNVQKINESLNSIMSKQKKEKQKLKPKKVNHNCLCCSRFFRSLSKVIFRKGNKK